MRKIVKVNYPKKKPRFKLEDLGNVAEPERYSMYQVLLDNLKIANRVTFLHRIIYVGEHSFRCYEDGKRIFESIILQANETYCIEKLSGFFLFYPQYFVHMVEGDEDNLNKHLGYLLSKDAIHASLLGAVKLLIHVSHINQRFFETWVSYTGVPPKLLEKLDNGMDLNQCGRYTFNCIKKIYSLIGNYAEDLSAATDGINTAQKSEGELAESSSTMSTPVQSWLYASFSYISARSEDRSDQIITRDYRLFLPEYELLDFIIKSDFTMALQDYYALYGVVPMRDIYKDRVWPVPHDFIPYDVFEKPYNCPTELPRDIRKKQRVTQSMEPRETNEQQEPEELTPVASMTVYLSTEDKDTTQFPTEESQKE